MAEPRGPERGDVIEFSYLWAHERAAGLLEGVKDRRCVIVAVLEDGRRVAVMPITGTELGHEHKIPLPGGSLRLERPSWIVTSELTVRSEIDPNLYPAGVKVADQEMTTINIHRHDFDGEWSYAIAPRTHP